MSIGGNTEIWEKKVRKTKIMDPTEEYDQLIRPVMISCHVFGCWSQQGPGGIISSKFHRTAILLFALIASTSTTAGAVVFWGLDMNETIECILVLSVLNLALLRIIVFASKRKDMMLIVETMRNDWLDSSPFERSVLRNKCRLAFKLAKFFIISVAMTILMFALMPIIEVKLADGETGQSKLPFRGYYFFNHTTSPRYECTYFVNSVIGCFSSSTIAGGTSFCLIATIHAAAKFALVQRDFRTLDSSDWTAGGPKIEGVVRKHLECIRFAEKVESVINFLALAQFITSTGLMCFAGFQLTTMLEDKTRLLKYAAFLQAAILELFLFSYSGHRLKTESENVADVTYLSNWIGTSSPTNFKMVSMRSSKPCTITAGKFYDMSLESFLKVMGSSFSYLTVLLAIKD
ncbi:odorant receptor 82a-like [Copidosoma floridanum]|uniref:odorant receptor 82a-like n=1 Tax=Copidosoma floridanum TaxID=29053 RepID=UPI0006C9D945|nr:odorant receptor 82a-like [Copidosoma floridanum]